MVEVISKGNGTKEVSCKSCGSVLRFSITEQIEDYSSDYLGDKTYYKYIKCPCCGYKVITS